MSDVTKVLPENIKVWVDALRSGDYPQCQGTLYNGLGFCCLGVYAELHKIATKEFMFVPLEEGVAIDEGPDVVYTAIRDSILAEVIDDGIDMNDRGESFIAIADMIEDYYLGDWTVEGDYDEHVY